MPKKIKKLEIPKGKFGEFSKIEEEFLECKEAFDNKCKIELLSELSDLIAAISSFVQEKFDDKITISDLIIKAQLKKNKCKNESLEGDSFFEESVTENSEN